MTFQESMQLRGALTRCLTIDDIDRWLSVAEADRAELLDIQQEIQGTVPPEDNRPANYFVQRARRIAREDLTLVVHGVTRADGVTNPRLARRVGLPGLAELDRAITRLRDAREKEAARPVLTWPRSYRLKAGKRHLVGDRYLLADEVIQLTESQAKSFGDKFEEVTV